MTTSIHDEVKRDPFTSTATKNHDMYKYETDLTLDARTSDLFDNNSLPTK